jgi:hypothetical protein
VAGSLLADGFENVTTNGTDWTGLADNGARVLPPFDVGC